jgi:undecaprenyl-diphosphatase
VLPAWQGWDEALFRRIHLAWRHPDLDPFFRLLTDPGRLMVPLILILAGALWMQGRRGAIGALILALTITASDQASSSLLKPLFHRSRPSVVLADARPLFGIRGSYSFPSVHAANSFAGALVLDAVFPGARIAWIVLAGLVSYSRVYVGDHWPSDVVAGALLGTLLGWVGRRAFRRLEARAAFGRRAEAAPSGAR